MMWIGEIALLASLIASGYAAVVSLWPASGTRRPPDWLALSAAIVATIGLSLTMLVLLEALVARDFRFDYVARYSSRLLPWQYRVSALWVGQAGSLLLWAWMTGTMGLALRMTRSGDAAIRRTAFGLVMGMVCFLASVMVFAANPMAPSLATPDEGLGLSPLLQHPSMMIHPPIVFLGYAAWAIPCALALAALGHGRLDTTWTQMARPWAILAWMLLGAGLLLGAHWAYQELGWGGYWGWDPVENGSLMPWLTGTALIHCLLAWRYRGCLKKTAVSLAVVTFGLCNFATFLTRSGIFSSVHAFSESPIGWMFLAVMAALFVGGAALILRRRAMLAAQQPIGSLFARESFILIAAFLLMLLTLVVLIGTLVDPVAMALGGQSIQVGPTFYNNVLAPIGLGLLAVTAAVPLLQWGASPTGTRRRLLLGCLAVSLASAGAAAAVGVRAPVFIALVALTTLAATSLPVALLHEVRRGRSRFQLSGLLGTLQDGRRKYAAYCIHLGFVAVAVGVAGSSLGTERREVNMDEGETIQWSDWQIRHVRLEQHEQPDKLVAEAVLEITRGDEQPAVLRPARHLHLLQNEWTTEVAIHSTWRGDFYTILHAGLGEGRVALTLIYNPMIRWIWLGGMFTAVCAVVAMWPERRRRRSAAELSPQATDELTAEIQSSRRATAA